MTETFYTVQEVAEKFKVSDRTVLTWIEEGKLGAFKMGRKYRIPESSITTFLENASTMGK